MISINNYTNRHMVIMKKSILFIVGLVAGYYIFDLFTQNPTSIFGKYILIHIAKFELVRNIFDWFCNDNRDAFLPVFVFGIDGLLFYWAIAIPLGICIPRLIIRGLIWGALAVTIRFYLITTITLHRAAASIFTYNSIHTQEATRRLESLHHLVAQIEYLRLKVVILMASILIPFAIYCTIGIKIRDITNKSTLLRASGPTSDPLRGPVI
jgi:hypothetical protein